MNECCLRKSIEIPPIILNEQPLTSGTSDRRTIGINTKNHRSPNQDKANMTVGVMETGFADPQETDRLIGRVLAGEHSLQPFERCIELIRRI